MEQKTNIALNACNKDIKFKVNTEHQKKERKKEERYQFNKLKQTTITQRKIANKFNNLNKSKNK